MNDLYKILTAIQNEIGGDDPCRVTVVLECDGSLRLTASWGDSGWNYQTMFTKLQIENLYDSSAMVDLFVVLAKESEAYKDRQEGAG